MDIADCDEEAWYGVCCDSGVNVGALAFRVPFVGELVFSSRAIGAIFAVSGPQAGQGYRRQEAVTE